MPLHGYILCGGNFCDRRLEWKSIYMIRSSFICILIVLLAVLLSVHPVYSSESATSSYLPGFQDTLAGIQPPPGWYMQEKLYNYTGDAPEVEGEGNIKLNLGIDTAAGLTVVNQVTRSKLWGSYYAWAVMIPVSKVQLKGQLQTPAGTPSFDEHLTSFSDAYFVPLMLGWNNGRSHQKAFFAFYAPTGNYNVNRVVNTGNNRWAIEFDYAYTFLDMRTGREFSIAPGYTINFENPDTNYLSGQEFHTDMAAVQRFPNGMGLGIVGYAFVQTTPDEGSGDRLGAFEGRTFALGGIMTYNFKGNPNNLSIVGKYYQEFDVTNRFKGHSFWLDFAFNF